MSDLLAPDGTSTLTTSLGFPQKAFDIRRDGRVAPLFSDPTGSGLDAPPQVLVQGTATCRTRSSPPPVTRLLGARSLAGYPTAVLGARDAEGAPTLLRVRPVPGDSGFAVDVPEDVEIRPGPASLLGHRHDENLANVKFVLVRGGLTGGPGEWTLVPSQEVQPAASAWSTIRRTRRSARDYLAKRGLARPRVDWAGFTAVADSVR